MVSREECERVGMIYVKSHYNRKGERVNAYCREKTNSENINLDLRSKK